MKRKRRLTLKGSKRLFTATAMKTHVKNVAPPPMRGGIRL